MNAILWVIQRKLIKGYYFYSVEKNVTTFIIPMKEEKSVCCTPWSILRERIISKEISWEESRNSRNLTLYNECKIR